MSSNEAPVDGRTLRKARNVTAVLDAVHELLLEGHPEPSADDVAARSGVSLRSIYRYFPDREHLLLAALERRLEAAEDAYRIDEPGEGSTQDRVAAFVDHRLAVHDEMAPTARVVFGAARHMPSLGQVVGERRAMLRDLVRQQFAPELDDLPEQRSHDVAVAVDVLCQFESVDALRRDDAMSDDCVRRVLAAGVHSLLLEA